MRLKGLLPFNAAEIDSNFAVVGGKDTQPVIRHLGTKPRQYRIQSRLKIGQRAFPHQRQARDEETALPTSEESRRSRQPRQSKARAMTCRPSRSVKHGQTFFWENGTEQHPPCRNFQSKKIFDADRLKRHDSVTVIGNAAADTDLWPNEAARNAKDF